MLPIAGFRQQILQDNKRNSLQLLGLQTRVVKLGAVVSGTVGQLNRHICSGQFGKWILLGIGESSPVITEVTLLLAVRQFCNELVGSGGVVLFVSWLLLAAETL